MKVMEDIVNLEIKLLIRFLKENHIFQLYLKKMWNENNYNAPKSLINYIKYINKEKLRYTKFLPKYKIFEDKFHSIKFITSNETLFSDFKLFSHWTEYPLVLNKHSSIEEGFEWCRYKQNFIEFKTFLKRINGYDKYFE